MNYAFEMKSQGEYLVSVHSQEEGLITLPLNFIIATNPCNSNHSHKKNWEVFFHGKRKSNQRRNSSLLPIKRKLTTPLLRRYNRSNKQKFATNSNLQKSRVVKCN